ncbi:hypothetical protein MNB_ARC-1_1137 [hydrothermal vent metagenome]|uniref:Uncharacterized protein n=1 Tax=hydrothermal vent metagenome TaxID=652676 RepID=A0A3B1E2D0_9ZZZZ
MLLEAYQLETAKYKKCDNGYYELSDTMNGSYYIFDDVVKYINTTINAKDEYDYLFVVNRNQSNEDGKLYEYVIKYSNLHFTNLDTTKGHLKIESEFFDKDIKRLNYVFEIIKTFYSSDQTDINILLISDLDDDELKNVLGFSDYKRPSSFDIKKMCVVLPVYEDMIVKVRNYVIPIFIAIFLLYSIDIGHKQYIGEKSSLVEQTIQNEKKKLDKETKDYKRLQKKLNSFSEFTKKDVYYDDL